MVIYIVAALSMMSVGCFGMESGSRFSGFEESSSGSLTTISESYEGSSYSDSGEEHSGDHYQQIDRHELNLIQAAQGLS